MEFIATMFFVGVALGAVVFFGGIAVAVACVLLKPLYTLGRRVFNGKRRV